MSSQTLTMAADAATEHPINTGLPLASEGRLSNTLLDNKNAPETSTLESKHIFEGVGEQTDGEVLMVCFPHLSGFNSSPSAAPHCRTK